MWWNQPTKLQVLDLALVVAFSWFYFRSSSDVHSVGEDISIDYIGIRGDFIILKIMCQNSLSEMLIGVPCVCVSS